MTVESRKLKVESRSGCENCFAFSPSSTLYPLPSTRGFSLVEIVVSLALFSIVMLVSTGALLSIVDANKKAQAQQTAFNNLNFALENMTRAIRVGTTYHAGNYGTLTDQQDSSSGQTFLAFEPYGGSPSNSADQVVYKLENSSIKRSADGGDVFSVVTSPQIVIEDLRFIVFGKDAATQPKVLIIVRGYAGSTEREKVSFALQTMVSQRLLDI